MKKTVKPYLLCLLLLIATAMPVSAKTATLIWDPSPSFGTAGYNIYYRTYTPTFPFKGTSLSEGASPVVVNGSAVTSLVIELPEDGDIYYFTATAFNYNGLESRFSNIVASEWIPILLAPINNAIVDTVVTFKWDRPPTNYKPSTSIVSFDLLYGTNPNSDDSAMAVSAPKTFDPKWAQFKLSIVLPLAVLLFLLMAIRHGFVKRFWQPVCIGFCIGLFSMQASCGGGGGSDDAEISAGTNIVTDIVATEYQITDLQADTRYYWKIVAIDNLGRHIVSLTQGFTTFGN
jgi:hypothetical protein